MMRSVPDITGSLITIGVVQSSAPVLTKLADEVFDISTEAPRLEEIMRLAIASIVKLYDFQNGIGIAAPQLGISKRAILFGNHLDNMFFLVNPRIISASNQIISEYEGCLSCWQFRGRVPRSSAVEIAGYAADGTEQYFELSNTLARMAQHECDHINGILYYQRMAKGEELISLEDYALLKAKI